MSGKSSLFGGETRAGDGGSENTDGSNLRIEWEVVNLASEAVPPPTTVTHPWYNPSYPKVCSE